VSRAAGDDTSGDGRQHHFIISLFYFIILNDEMMIGLGYEATRGAADAQHGGRCQVRVRGMARDSRSYGQGQGGLRFVRSYPARCL